MAFLAVVPGICALGGLAATLGSRYVRDRYSPPEGVQLKEGEHFVNHNGKKFTVLDQNTVQDESGTQYHTYGWSGHSSDTLQQDLTQKELYTGPKYLAQSFAVVNAGKNNPEKQAVGLIGVKKENAALVTYSDSRFENGYSPLEPKSMQEAGVHAVHIEKVTPATDAQTFACFKRMIGEWDVNRSNNSDL